MREEWYGNNYFRKNYKYLEVSMQLKINNEKKELKLPSEIKNVIRCHNPRCITSIEQGLDHVFVLTDPENEVYRCKYCEEKYTGKRNK